MVLAGMYVKEWEGVHPQSRLYDYVGTAGLIGVFLHMSLLPYSPIALAFVLPMTLFTIYLGVFRGTFTMRLLRNRWLVTIGGICYSIYLWHYIDLYLTPNTTAGFRATHPYVWIASFILTAFLTGTVISYS